MSVQHALRALVGVNSRGSFFGVFHRVENSSALKKAAAAPSVVAAVDVAAAHRRVHFAPELESVASAEAPPLAAVPREVAEAEALRQQLAQSETLLASTNKKLLRLKQEKDSAIAPLKQELEESVKDFSKRQEKNEAIIRKLTDDYHRAVQEKQALTEKVADLEEMNGLYDAANKELEAATDVYKRGLDHLLDIPYEAHVTGAEDDYTNVPNGPSMSEVIANVNATAVDHLDRIFKQFHESTGDSSSSFVTSVRNLANRSKRVAHIFDESPRVIHVDGGEAPAIPAQTPAWHDTVLDSIKPKRRPTPQSEFAQPQARHDSVPDFIKPKRRATFQSESVPPAWYERPARIATPTGRRALRIENKTTTPPLTSDRGVHNASKLNVFTEPGDDDDVDAVMPPDQDLLVVPGPPVAQSLVTQPAVAAFEHDALGGE